MRISLSNKENYTVHNTKDDENSKIWFMKFYTYPDKITTYK